MGRSSVSKRRSRVLERPIPLDAPVVMAVHEQLTKDFEAADDPISPPGVRDRALLESAVLRQHTGLGDQMKYADRYENAAALIYGVCNNHPFFNGNKRTALVSGLMHLDRNNLVLEGVTRDDLFRMMRRIASHFFSQRRKGGDVIPDPDNEIASIAAWLRDNSRDIKRGERSIPYSELYRIIQGFGFRLGEKRNNHVEVLRRKRRLIVGEKWVCVYKLPCPGDSRIVQLHEIKSVRRALGLTEADGVDSASFYDTRVIIDSFIISNRAVLRDLAKI